MVELSPPAATRENPAIRRSQTDWRVAVGITGWLSEGAEQSSKMSASVLTVFLILTISSPSSLAINFPSSKPAQGRLVFNRQTFSTASCAASGETVTTVSLNTGEGRVFQSPNYPANYPDGQSCTYNFEPAAGNQLVFSCSDYDLKATSSVGDLCTGDYLRFYDANGQLGQSGTRYCHTTGPAFSYTTNINVLFKTNNDGTTGKGRRGLSRLRKIITNLSIYRF